MNPGQTLTKNWHIDAVCYQLEQMTNGLADCRLVLCQPPRSLKSFIVTICFPAWRLGSDPTLSIIVASYADELSKKFSRDYRSLIETPFYRRLFPNARPNPRKSPKPNRKPSLAAAAITTSVGGTLTGRGADILIVDDPIKALDAPSELARKNVQEWFLSTAYTRRNRPGESLVVVTMQRLHADDLAGVLMDQGWPSLVIPAIASDGSITYVIAENESYARPAGEILQPQRDSMEAPGCHETRDRFLCLRRAVSADPHSCRRQPRKKGVAQILRSQFKAAHFRSIVLGCDPAAKPGAHNDNTAIVVAGISDNDVIVLHAAQGHWTQLQMDVRIRELAAQYNIDLALIEDTASGVGLIQDLRRESNLSVLAVKTTENKENRFYAQLSLFEAGQGTFAARSSLAGGI